MGDKLTIHLLSIVNDHDDLHADHDTEERIMPDDHGRNYNDADDLYIIGAVSNEKADSLSYLFCHGGCLSPTIFLSPSRYFCPGLTGSVGSSLL